jgi:hypothetical protein
MMERNVDKMIDSRDHTETDEKILEFSSQKKIMNCIRISIKCFYQNHYETTFYEAVPLWITSYIN